VAAKADDNNGWVEAGQGGGGEGVTVWKTTVAEETRWMVGGKGATRVLTITTTKTINK
jgi:hypothetical protein